MAEGGCKRLWLSDGVTGGAVVAAVAVAYSEVRCHQDYREALKIASVPEGADLRQRYSKYFSSVFEPTFPCDLRRDVASILRKNGVPVRQMRSPLFVGSIAFCAAAALTTGLSTVLRTQCTNNVSAMSDQQRSK